MSKESKQRGKDRAALDQAHKRLLNRHEVLRAMSEGKIKAVVDLIDGDGHSLWPIATLTDECGWHPEAAECVCQEFKSDGSGKGDIFDQQGSVIQSLKGWYGLDLLYSIASAYGIKYEGCMGRGFQARAIDKAIREHFKWEAVHVSATAD